MKSLEKAILPITAIVIVVMMAVLVYSVYMCAVECIGESAAQAVATSIEPMTHVVVKGDSLWSIAANELGSPSRWREIAELNHLERPYRIVIGMELRLP